VIRVSKNLKDFFSKDTDMRIKNIYRCKGSEDVTGPRVTDHDPRLLRFLTFIFISLILMGATAGAQAENSRKNSYIRMEETEIIGVVEHPDITYIIPKTRVRFTPIPLERDFSDRTTHYRNPLDLENEVRVRTLLSGP